MGHSYRPEETQPLQVIAKGPRTPSGCTCLTEHLLCERHLAKLQRHNSYFNGSQPRPLEQNKQKQKDGIWSTLRTKPQLSPTCGSRDSEAEEAGCLMVNALVRTHSGVRRAGVTHHQQDPKSLPHRSLLSPAALGEGRVVVGGGRVRPPTALLLPPRAARDVLIARTFQPQLCPRTPPGSRPLCILSVLPEHPASPSCLHPSRNRVHQALRPFSDTGRVR